MNKLPREWFEGAIAQNPSVLKASAQIRDKDTLYLSPHIHVLFHAFVSTEKLKLPIVGIKKKFNVIDFMDSPTEEGAYFLATMYYGHEATQKQLDAAVETVKAMLTLRYA